MTDQVIMDLYLMLLKSTIEVYVHGTLESSNEEIRALLREGLDETLTHQANTYDLMASNDWYTITNVKANEIKKTYNKVKIN